MQKEEVTVQLLRNPPVLRRSVHVLLRAFLLLTHLQEGRLEAV